jgi:hypothetical protein
MDDPKKKGELDPVFDQVMKGFMNPPPKADIFDPSKLQFETMKHRAPVDPFKIDPFFTPLPYVPFDDIFGNADPFGKPPKSVSERILDLLTDVRRRLPPVAPASPIEAKLFAVATELGYKPISDAVFGLDVETMFLHVVEKEPATVRAVCVAHEVGHALVNRKLGLTADDIKRFNALHPNDEQKRKIIRNEMLAWREGMRQLRLAGGVFKHPRAVRAIRRSCISTYRALCGFPAGAVKNLQLKGA